MPQAQTYFNDCWLEEDAFKSQLSKAADKKQARCRLCKKNFELSNVGKKALLSHAAGKNHSEKDVTIKIFFKTANQKNSAKNDNGSSSNSSAHVVNQSSKLVQPTLELITTNSENCQFFSNGTK